MKLGILTQDTSISRELWRALAPEVRFFLLDAVEMTDDGPVWREDVPAQFVAELQKAMEES